MCHLLSSFKFFVLFFQDRYSTDNVEPTIDAKQDYKLLGGYETDTKTVLKFQRSYDTCDLQDWKITVSSKCDDGHYLILNN